VPDQGADRESSPVRPVLSVAEVYRLPDAIEPRYRALILLATFGNLRWGELAGLRRRNLDLDHRIVRVVETVYELDRLVKGTPKSEASTRKITLPELIIPELRRHLDAFTPAGRMRSCSSTSRAGNCVAATSPSLGRVLWAELACHPASTSTIFGIPGIR
jgi:integrase